MKLACLDGQIIPAEQAVIPVTDDGLLRGDGVFEAAQLYDGRPYAMDEHLERMVKSARNLRLELDIDAVAADVEALLEAAKPQEGLVRMLVTRGGHRIVVLEPLIPLPDTISLGCVTYSPTHVLDGVKSLSYAANMLCGRLARERGFDEALMVSPHGRVLEAPTSSFFWVAGGELYTPPLSERILDSITRRAVIASCDVTEQSTTLDELRSAEEAFVASSLREVLPVHAIEEIAFDAPGPVTLATTSAVKAYIAHQLAATAG